MLSTSDHIYNKFQNLAKTVKADLAKKGLAIPRKNGDGTISVERFKIVKGSTGLYSIVDSNNETIVNNINLPETAVLLANGLALGKWLDQELYNVDRDYGYKLFEEQLYKRNAVASLKQNKVDRADMLFTRSKIAHSKVESAKRTIQHSFEKLRRVN